jgi:hypothetical protein
MRDVIGPLGEATLCVNSFFQHVTGTKEINKLF